MAKGYVLYNGKAGHEQSLEEIRKYESVMIKDSAEPEYMDVLTIEDYEAFFSRLKTDDYIVLVGGDGTINRFVNNTDGLDCKNRIFYLPNGTGNDFAHDFGYERGCEPFEITNALKDLPVVTVKDKKYRFINGIGYGIDGYCCEVGDELKKIPGKKVNYTVIAIKGLLFHYKTTNAKVTIDGETRTYKKVWLVPTMKGRFYGGGMIPTPEQRRDNGNGILSTMILFGSGKLKTLMIFPSIFKGEHVKHHKHVEVLTGHEIEVEFDRPTSLQIDGETILGVTSYRVSSRMSK